MTSQLMTFQVGPDTYGIDVLKVQEVTRELPVVTVPLAPDFVSGLINLRGQIATAIGLKELFGLREIAETARASVVCRIDGGLVSLQVGAIGDVVEVRDEQFEPAPDTVPAGVMKFIKGIYKTDGALLSVVDLEKLAKELF